MSPFHCTLGACNPMLCPNHVSRLGLASHSLLPSLPPRLPLPLSPSHHPTHPRGSGLLELEGLSDRLIKNLSGGQKRRVSFVRQFRRHFQKKMGPHSPAHLVRLRPAAHSPCDVRRCSAHAYRVRIGPCNPMLAARPMPVRRPARWCTTRSCWCSMSPRWGSTRCCGPRSGRTSST